jgi:hypothetical protein
MCQADAAKRPNVGEMALRLATLDARAEARILRAQEVAEFEAARSEALAREQERALDANRIDYLTRRRKMLWGVVTGLLTLLGITSGALYSANQQRQLAQAQSNVVTAQTQLARAKAVEADRASKRAEAVRETVMQSLVDATNPYAVGDPAVKVVDLLEPLSQKLSSELSAEPAYVARISHSFAIALIFAKDYAGAERLYRKALSATLPVT